MKEQRITVEIDREGSVSAHAEGFSGDTCLSELDRLLEGLSAGTASVERRPDAGTKQVTTARTQPVGRKP